ncbi:hypothetical protein [uncultured Veillonella sp.]|uniref:hypothetical protein n=1 Tax=uncultured Veillonella sp. TaxID=159268 RepID=UPI0025F5A7CB|nr:hypothetical protein [uncultured Veillonella sp.]
MKSALLLPERREGKTKVIRQQHLPFTVLKQWLRTNNCRSLMCEVATVLTVYGIETRTPLWALADH